MPADPRPPRRVRDPHLLTRLHCEWRECALCGTRYPPLSLHHLHKHPRDDLEENLVMLCGSGTTGCHGKVEQHDVRTCQLLAAYLIENRLDTMRYLGVKLGSLTAVVDWFNRSLHYSRQ